MLATKNLQSLSALTKICSPIERCLSANGLHGEWKFIAARTQTPSVRYKSSWFCNRKSSCSKKELMDLNCKIAIVTGGATGIGYGAAFQLLCEGAAHVVIGGIVPSEGAEAVKKLNDKFGKDKAVFYKSDVNSHCEFDNLFKETINKYGQVDILFNNAGMLDDKRWELEIDTNIKGTLRGCFLAFQYMGKDCCGKGGVVINNASILGFQSFYPAPVYCCTKHAIIGITKCLGDPFHYAQNDLRFCSLCPGVTNTALVSESHDRQLTPEWSKETKKLLEAMPKQEIQAAGQAVTWICKNGQSAHHYIIEDSKVLHATIPDRKTFSKVVADYKAG